MTMKKNLFLILGAAVLLASACSKEDKPTDGREWILPGEDTTPQTATITVDGPEKSKIDIEMEQWEARANDEFGKTLKEIEKASMEFFGYEENEYGFHHTPLSWPITAYSLDGNRKYTAKVIIGILDNWDILEDENIKALADKLNQLAA